MAATAPTPAHSSDIADQTFMSAVESVCGVEVANKLSQRFGGCVLYIPSKPKPHHALCELVGMEAAVAIAEIRGNENVNIPLRDFGSHARRRAMIERLLLEGVSVRRVSRQVGCTDRTVFTARKRLREAGKSREHRRLHHRGARCRADRR